MVISTGSLVSAGFLSNETQSFLPSFFVSLYALLKQVIQMRINPHNLSEVLLQNGFVFK